MLFWIAVILMLCAVVAVVVWPLIREQQDSREEADFDIEVFRDQLAEVVREHDEGRLEYAEAEAAKAEISRRILAADTARRQQSHAISRQPAAAVALAAILIGSAVSAYLYTGSPGQPSRPFAERAEERKQHAERQNRGRMDLASLANRLKKRLEKDTDSVEGWQLLARTYMTMGNFADAVPTFERLMALRPGDAGTYAAYAEAITLAANGSVTPKSRAAFEQALSEDAEEPTSRFYLGLADWQSGEYQQAYDRWISLMGDTRADAPWAEVLQQRLTEASEKLGLDVAALPKPSPAAASSAPAAPALAQAPGGPSRTDVAAAQEMSPKDRQEMIRGMVTGLAAKLEENPANFEGWMRLIRSYGVLGDKAKAKGALDKALSQFERAPFVKRQLLALGGELGLADAKEAGGSDTVSAPRGPTAEQMRDAQNMSAEDRQEMIEGMVAGLAAKLEENPNDLQGWIRLARSYNVLQKPEEARDAMARAAKVAPENVDILTLYARTIRTAAGNQPTAASAQIMQRILTLDPDNVEALFFTGLAANGAGDKEEARRLWEKAKSGLPENSPQRAAVQRQMDSLGK